MPSPPLVSTSKNILENKNRTLPAVCYFTCKIEFASNILWMIVGTMFQLRLTILIRYTKIAQKGCFWPKKNILKKWTPPLNSAYANWNMQNLMVVFTFSVPIFSLNWEFWCFGPNLPEKTISDLKLKNWTFSLNSVYLN